MTATPNLRSWLTAGLAALVLGGQALVCAAPARAADFVEEDYVVRPRAERRVIVEERREMRPFEERRFLGPRYLGPPEVARPVVYGRPFYGRPAYGGGECRLIIKKRVSPWGDEVIKRIRVCD